MKQHHHLRFLSAQSTFLIIVPLSVSRSFSRNADFGVRGEVYTEQSEGFLGAEGLFNLTQVGGWYGNPNVEHAFLDGGVLTSVSMDFHYDSSGGAPSPFWAGAGPTLPHSDGNLPPGHDKSDAGLNLLFGVGAKKGAVRPRGQVKAVPADNSRVVIGIGARF